MYIKRGFFIWVMVLAIATAVTSSIQLTLGVPFSLVIGLLPTAIAMLWVVQGVDKNVSIINQHFAIPSTHFLMYMGYLIFIGSIDHALQVYAGSNYIYLESVFLMYMFICLSLVFWRIGYIASKYFSGLIGKRSLLKKTSDACMIVRRWDQGGIFYLSVLLGVFGVLSFSYFFVKYIGGAPLIMGIAPNSSFELRSIIFGHGATIHSIAVNLTTFAIIYLGLYLIVIKRNVISIALFLLSVLMFLLWGARIYLVAPFFALIALYTRVNGLTLNKILAYGLVLFFAFAMYGQVRNRVQLDINVPEADIDVLVAAADVHMAPEFRDALGVISHLDTLQAEYEASTYFAGVFMTAIPSRILAVVGIDKDRLFSDEGTGSGWLVAEVTRGFNWTGVRSGIIGQTLMAVYLEGLLGLFFLYGFVFYQLDRLSINLDPKDPIMLYVYVVGALLASSVLTSTHSFFSKFWLTSYVFILIYFLFSKKYRFKTDL